MEFLFVAEGPKPQYEYAVLPSQNIEKHGAIPASIPKAPAVPVGTAPVSPEPPAGQTPVTGK
jgi:hypothetical protein